MSMSRHPSDTPVPTPAVPAANAAARSPDTHEHDHGDHHDHDHDHDHDHVHEHAHDHNESLAARLLALVGIGHGHTHGPVQIDPALEGSAEGIQAIRLSLLILGATAVVQAVIALLSGSAGLLADTIHNGADALTALPLW